jgi:hypothetical protein
MDGRSVMIDLRSSELHRADFIEGSCTPSILRQVEERKVNAPPLGSDRPVQTDVKTPAAQGAKP